MPGFLKWGRLLGGDNLGKMAKNCIKITKYQNQHFGSKTVRGTWWDKPIL